jgi:hypothetical protein
VLELDAWAATCRRKGEIARRKIDGYILKEVFSVTMNDIKIMKSNSL